MVNVSSAWRRTLFDDKRNYHNYVKITLTNNTVLNLTNEHLWEGGVALDDAVSSESDFQIGSAIINKATFTINNIYGDYDAYDFIGARVEYKVGLDVGDVADEIIKKGKYIICNATYNGQTISIEAYDYMYFFDIPYVHPNVTYPATIDAIVRAMCTEVGVTLATLNFPHKNHVIQEPPSSQQVTYREVLSWCAQICGCFARCNNEGQLELKWYPQSDLTTVMSGLDGGHFDSSNPYSSGDTANGGSFNPWSTGYVFDGGSLNWNYNVHLISSIYSQSISVDDVVITGIRATIKVEGEDEEDEGSSEKTVTVGQSGYVIDISGNEFLTIDNVDDVLAWLGVQLIGFTFRKASVTHASDPAIEAGDCAIIFDRHKNAYPIVVSVTRFTSGNTQSTVSSAQNPLRNSASRFSAATKNYVDLRERLQNEKTTRELMEAQLADAVANSNGLYLTTEIVGGATKYYLHNKPLLNDSAIRILVSTAGITVTADYGSHWYGLTASGDMIAHLLSATGINADWINSGAISISDGNGNETFYANTATGVVRINATQIKINSSSIASQSDITALSNQISSKVSAGDIASTINQTAQSVLINASKINLSGYATSSELTVLSNQVSSKVSAGDIASTINQTAQSVLIQASKINLNGYVTFTNLSTSGQTTINGSNVTTGTINANNVGVINLNADNITAGTLDGRTVRCSGSMSRVEINSSQGNIDGGRINFQSKPSSSSSSYSQTTGFMSGSYASGSFPNNVQVKAFSQLDLYGGSYGISLFSNGDIIGDCALMTVQGGMTVTGNLKVNGTKDRVVKTENYGERELYCYEMPSPMFGDIGEGVIGEDGKCYVSIDPIFSDTINSSQYQVMLQAYGNGACYVSDRKSTYFIVEGTSGLNFGWELKAKQLGYEQRRINTPVSDTKDHSYEYIHGAEEHLKQIKEERELA